MDVHVTQSTVRGTTRAPPSKSYTHRALLAAGYSDGATVRSPLVSADTKATARAVSAFGGAVASEGDEADADGATDVDETDDADAFVVDGFDGRPAVPDDVIDCANSGTTMRLVTATAALADGTTVLTGDESLRSRPQGPLLDALSDLGVRAASTRDNGRAPLVVSGPLSGGAVAIPGDVSSQYVTALLMAGAVTERGIEIELTTALKSAPYVDITLELLDDFGIEAEPIGSDSSGETGADGAAGADGAEGAAGAAGAEGFSVPGGQSYAPEGDSYTVPGDFSSISYLVAAGAVAAEAGGSVRIEGARPSAQGDSAIVDVAERMGAEIDWDRDAGVITVARSDLSGVEVDVGDTPDLLPTVAALGAVADGDTRIVNCEHVRYKETDRVAAMAEELETLGAETTEERDVLTIHGSESDLRGATVDGRADHRIVMSLAVAGLVAEGTTTIRGGEHVDVSFPGFFDAMADLGMDVERDGAGE